MAKKQTQQPQQQEATQPQEVNPYTNLPYTNPPIAETKVCDCGMTIYTHERCPNCKPREIKFTF